MFEMPITVTQAIFGDTVDVPTLDKPARVEIPAGIKNGTVIKVKGKGVKDLRRNAYGDIVITVKVDIPRNVGIRQRKEIKDSLEQLDKSAQYDEVEKFKKKLKSLD